MSLQEWKNVQSQTTAAMTTELQEKWGPNIRNHIMSSLRDVGKGWFNLQETNRDIYEFSKLKRLLKLITFSMVRLPPPESQSEAIRAIMLEGGPYSLHGLWSLTDQD